MNKGLFISFEGPDGSGKSTQLALLKSYCQEKGYEILCTREPGGTAISEKIRELLLDYRNTEMIAEAEALLYAASRAQLVKQVIKPALEEGKIVLSDRFMDSSIAYQGFGRKLGDGVRLINEFAVQGLQPDLTFFLDLDPKEGKNRVLALGKPDRIEGEAMNFHYAVYEGYKELCKHYAFRYVRIDASLPKEEIANIIQEKVDSYVAKRSQTK